MRDKRNMRNNKREMRNNKHCNEERLSMRPGLRHHLQYHLRQSSRVLGVIATILIALLALSGEALVGPLLTSQAGKAQAQSSIIISQILVTGNQRIEPETVTSYMEINVGDTYDPAKVNTSLRALFRTGLFSDVRIFLTRRTVLVVQVAENPIINRVNFEGNKELTDKQLAKEVELRARVVFTAARAQKDVERITTLYRRAGRFAAKVVPKIIKLSQNRVDLVYEIIEGPVTRVERINFVGNQGFSDSTLRGVIATAETRWWKFYSRSDNYDPDRLNFDKELLRRHYLKHGYADFRVISAVAELARDGQSFFITISVEEGPQYRFGKTKIVSSLPELNIDDLLPTLRIVEGEIYNASLIDKSVDKLAAQAGKRGFAFARARPKINRNREALVIDITFEVKEGPRVYIERINIVGNVRTLDRVIRRTLRLAEGDAYNRILVDRARRRITALDFFSKVEIKQTPGSAPDKVVLSIVVVEKSTGSLSFGAGFSTSETILGDVSITERNFLGKGQFVRLRTSLSFKRQQVDFKFTEPYFLGRRMTFGVDAFATETDSEEESSFSSRRIGGGVRFGFPLSENSTFFLRYSLSYNDLDVLTTASLAVLSAEGKFITSSAGYSWVFTTLDNPLDPTTGVKLAFHQDLAGLGGDVFYYRTNARADYYSPLYWPKLIGHVTLSAGHIDGWNGKALRAIDAFYKGGQSFRGFARAGIGPRDLVGNKDAIGGQVFAIGTAELIFPLGLPEQFGLRGAVFTDIGTLFDAPVSTATSVDTGSIRASVGASILWKSPLGPIRLDFGQAILKESHDKTEFFRFSGGTTF